MTYRSALLKGCREAWLRKPTEGEVVVLMSALVRARSFTNSFGVKFRGNPGRLVGLVLLSTLCLSAICQAQSAPTISYTNPVNGPVGTSITIVGNYFGSTQGSSTLTFNGTVGTPTSWSNTQIVAPVPSGATTGPVVVTVGGVASNHVNFTVGTPPTISYTNPVNGPAGTSVTIVGTYFGATLGTSTLAFNGTSATPTSWSSTQIVAA